MDSFLLTSSVSTICPLRQWRSGVCLTPVDWPTSHVANPSSLFSACNILCVIIFFSQAGATYGRSWHRFTVVIMSKGSEGHVQFIKC